MKDQEKKYAIKFAKRLGREVYNFYLSESNYKNRQDDLVAGYRDGIEKLIIDMSRSDKRLVRRKSMSFINVFLINQTRGPLEKSFIETTFNIWFPLEKYITEFISGKGKYMISKKEKERKKQETIKMIETRCKSPDFFGFERISLKILGRLLKISENPDSKDILLEENFYARLARTINSCYPERTFKQSLFQSMNVNFKILDNVSYNQIFYNGPFIGSPLDLIPDGEKFGEVVYKLCIETHSLEKKVFERFYEGLINHAYLNKS